jgi:hypothetical protein
LSSLSFSHHHSHRFEVITGIACQCASTQTALLGVCHPAANSTAAYGSLGILPTQILRTNAALNLHEVELVLGTGASDNKEDLLFTQSSPAAEALSG